MQGLFVFGARHSERQGETMRPVGDHFYTTSAPERDNAVGRFGYLREGTACGCRRCRNVPPSMSGMTK